MKANKYEVLRRVLEIVEGYVLLAPQIMLSTYTIPLMDGFARQLGKDLKPEANNIVTSVVEMIIRTSSAVGPDAVNAVGKAFVESGFIIKIFEGIYGTWQAHQTSGPNKKYPQVESIVITDYLQILSRLVMCDTRMFLDVVEYVGSMNFAGAGIENTMKWLLEEWFSHVSVSNLFLRHGQEN